MEGSGEATNFASKVRDLRNFGRNHGLSEKEMDECVKEALMTVAMRSQGAAISEYVADTASANRPISRKRVHPIFGSAAAVFVIVVVACCALIAFHRPTQKFVSRQAQTLIYPFMRYWRIVTLPVQTRFPAMMGWHEQQCIVYNPFYRNPDLTCWPCEKVRTVADLTFFEDFTTSYYQNMTPFVIKNLTAKAFTLAMLQDLYASNTKALDKGTTSFHSTCSSSSILGMPKDILNSTRLVCPDLHIRWQFRRVSSARVLRKTFRRPYLVPNTTEVSLERYIFVDGLTSSPYTLPLTEFANVWLTHVSGERSVVLLPSPHCKSNCAKISTTLSAGDTLFYNWQFWRATFIPSETSAGFAITYMGSSY